MNDRTDPASADPAMQTRSVIPPVLLLCVLAVATALFVSVLATAMSASRSTSWLTVPTGEAGVPERAGWEGEPVRAQSIGATANMRFPELTGRVVDLANLVDAPAEAALASELAAFEASSSDQVVVLTISSLEGAVLEDYANRLFRHWGIGQTGQNNGVLLLVAHQDRQIRIEVGYGLEGILTDALSRLIIETEMVPAFRDGRFSDGITGGARLIMKTLGGDIAELEARRQAFGERQRNSGPDWELIIFWTIWMSIFVGPIAFGILARTLGEKTGKNTYRWLGIDVVYGGGSGRSGRSGSSGRSSGGWSSRGGFSGGGGSSGGGGASGRW